MEKRKRTEAEEDTNKRQKTDTKLDAELTRLIQKANEEQVKSVLSKLVLKTESQSVALDLLKSAVSRTDNPPLLILKDQTPSSVFRSVHQW